MSSGATVLFVSHNLKAITELCQRTMLLGHGKVAMIGPTDLVVRRYLGDFQKTTDDARNKPVYVSQVLIRDGTGERSMFESGQKAWVDISITANERVDKLAVVLTIRDADLYLAFSTSTERLGHPPFSLHAGESYRCTFELTLNMAHGTFHVGAAIHRYDLQKEYGYLAAAPVFIGSSLAVRGAVNCFPKLFEAGIVTTVCPSEWALEPGKITV